MHLSITHGHNQEEAVRACAGLGVGSSGDRSTGGWGGGKEPYVIL